MYHSTISLPNLAKVSIKLESYNRAQSRQEDAKIKRVCLHRSCTRRGKGLSDEKYRSRFTGAREKPAVGAVDSQCMGRASGCLTVHTPIIDRLHRLRQQADLAGIG